MVVTELESPQHETARPGALSGYVEWGPVFAGAVASLAVSFVLLTFGAAVGLSAVSPWTSSSASVNALAIGSAFWVLIVSLWSFALGGYFAARMRNTWPGASTDEVEFRDKAHGLLSWALAIVLAATVAAFVAAPGRSTASDAVTRSAAATTAVDAIVRSPRVEVAPASETLRAEVGRILVTNVGRTDLDPGDKQFLTALHANRTGAPQADAERQVAQAVATFKDTTNQARKAGIVMAFLAASTLLVSAATAWWAAGLGGQHRDTGTVWEAFRHHPRGPVNMRTR